MSDQIRKEIIEHTRAARGGDARDSQGDGVADAAAEVPDAAADAIDAEAVPRDHERSITEDQGTDDASGSRKTGNAGT